MNFSLFLTELWNARINLLAGLGDTVLISVASVLLGTFLGVFVGLAMTYGISRPGLGCAFISTSYAVRRFSF